MSTTIVKRAIHAFQQGDYHNAKQLYLQAADKYGHQLFSANLTLCDHALEQHRPKRVTAALRPYSDQTLTPVSQQLADTQLLLEHYYTRYQEVIYQLQDKE